jgi:hypothetical protein
VPGGGEIAVIDLSLLRMQMLGWRVLVFLVLAANAATPLSFESRAVV